MNPLILSLICLLLVGVSANWLSIVKNNKTLIYLSLAPCIYIAIYGIYLVIGPVDLYEDGSKNFFMQNPYESELPPQFLLLKLYQYILIGVGLIFGYICTFFIFPSSSIPSIFDNSSEFLSSIGIYLEFLVFQSIVELGNAT